MELFWCDESLMDFRRRMSYNTLSFMRFPMKASFKIPSLLLRYDIPWRLSVGHAYLNTSTATVVSTEMAESQNDALVISLALAVD